MSITVLMNAGPWLPVPPRGYGGIETVVATLVPELRARGVRVVLATVGASTLEADDRMHVFETGQFPHLQRPYNQVMGLAHAHLQRVVAELRRRRDIDLVHDHMEAVGLAVWGALGRSAPPVLHTLHWDLRKHPELYGGFDGGGRVWVNGVSASQLARAPRNLREHSLGWAHLATPLAAVVPASPATGTTAASPAATGHDRTGPMVILGRISPLKGQHLGARLCRELGIPLIMAGPVGGLDGPGSWPRRSPIRVIPPTSIPTCATTWSRWRRTSTTSSSGGSARWTARGASGCSARPGRRCSRCSGRSPAARPWSRRWPAGRPSSA
nr:hypothetical protein GCM10020093_022850 [Planobispora longispora]